ncbi:hypothetical protein [Lacihabitans lacunae]|uniref:Lipoprotein n=1 Tax=Lacihabitans lacunae TaxID=1028214 RepID=A0ABV7YY55_9BACT
MKFKFLVIAILAIGLSLSSCVHHDYYGHRRPYNNRVYVVTPRPNYAYRNYRHRNPPRSYNRAYRHNDNRYGNRNNGKSRNDRYSNSRRR